MKGRWKWILALGVMLIWVLPSAAKNDRKIYFSKLDSTGVATVKVVDSISAVAASQFATLFVYAYGDRTPEILVTVESSYRETEEHFEFLYFEFNPNLFNGEYLHLGFVIADGVTETDNVWDALLLHRSGNTKPIISLDENYSFLSRLPWRYEQIPDAVQVGLESYYPADWLSIDDFEASELSVLIRSEGFFYGDSPWTLHRRFVQPLNEFGHFSIEHSREKLKAEKSPPKIRLTDFRRQKHVDLAWTSITSENLSSRVVDSRGRLLGFIKWQHIGYGRYAPLRNLPKRNWLLVEFTKQRKSWKQWIRQ